MSEAKKVLLTRKEAASCLGVCTRTLRRLELEGKLNPVRRGRAVRFYANEIYDLGGQEERLRKMELREALDWICSSLLSFAKDFEKEEAVI
jgi:excisionase family DNA binding protein